MLWHSTSRRPRWRLLIRKLETAAAVTPQSRMNENWQNETARRLCLCLRKLVPQMSARVLQPFLLCAHLLQGQSMASCLLPLSETGAVTQAPSSRARKPVCGSATSHRPPQAAVSVPPAPVAPFPRLHAHAREPPRHARVRARRQKAERCTRRLGAWLQQVTLQRWLQLRRRVQLTVTGDAGGRRTAGVAASGPQRKPRCCCCRLQLTALRMRWKRVHASVAQVLLLAKQLTHGAGSVPARRGWASRHCGIPSAGSEWRSCGSDS